MNKDLFGSLQTSGIGNCGRHEPGVGLLWQLLFQQIQTMGNYFVNLAQVSVMLAQQDIFMSLVPVKRKRMENLNFILVALK